MTHDDLSRRGFLRQSAGGAAAAVALSQLHTLAYAAPAQKAWTQLFDGKTLKGWHKNPERIGHGTGGNWQVEDGSITGEQDPPGSGNGGILLTDQKFGDFELELEIKPDWGVCSGLFLRSNDRGQCIQMMVDYHDAGNVGHLYGEGTGGFSTRTFDVDGKYDGDKKLTSLVSNNHKTAAAAGLISSCTPEAWLKSWKLGDWNLVRVVMTGKYPHITTWINGLQVCEFDGERSTVERYQKDEILKSLTAEGSIAVQVHGGKGWPTGAKCRWKNIRIRSV